jgi:hypothetical protein
VLGDVLDSIAKFAKQWVRQSLKLSDAVEKIDVHGRIDRANTSGL